LNLDQVSPILGYSHEEMESLSDGANLGLGCGNPQTITGVNL
jgi:arsenite methyltransferase